MWVGDDDKTVSKLATDWTVLGITAVGSFLIGMVFDGTDFWVVVLGSAVVKMQPSTGAVLAT